MSRVDDVIDNFIYTRGCAGLNEDSKKLLSDAVRYGFEQGESFGKYGAFIEKQNEKIAEAIIQPENDKMWQKEPTLHLTDRELREILSYQDGVDLIGGYLND